MAQDNVDPAAAFGLPAGTPVPAYVELSKIMFAGQPQEAVLSRIAELARDAVVAAAAVSVTLMEKGTPRSAAFAGQVALDLDERQYGFGHGPCLDAAVAGDIILVEDIGTSHKLYPTLAEHAHRHGVRHILSIGLQTVRDITGALNLYSAGAQFDAAARHAAVTFADYASVAVINAALYAGALQEAEHMRQAMASRAVIEQAKGVILRDQRCTPEEAFDMLREASMRSNRKLRDIAESIVRGAST